MSKCAPAEYSASNVMAFYLTFPVKVKDNLGDHTQHFVHLNALHTRITQINAIIIKMKLLEKDSIT